MYGYLGTLEQLKKVVAVLGYKGTWKDIPNGQQFRAEVGPILNLFSNGALQFQGRDDVRKPFEISVGMRLKEWGVLVAGPQSPPAAVPEPPAEREKIFVVHGHD